MTNIEELKTQLEEGLNITRIVEIKPGSQLLVVCKVSGKRLLYEHIHPLRAQIEEALKSLLDNQSLTVLVTDSDLELDFYRIDNDAVL